MMRSKLVTHSNNKNVEDQFINYFCIAYLCFIVLFVPFFSVISKAEVWTFDSCPLNNSANLICRFEFPMQLLDCIKAEISKSGDPQKLLVSSEV